MLACKRACVHANNQGRGHTNRLARCSRTLHSPGMIIAVVNQKGGVGKTTLAVHLAAWHLEQGRRVAFIDADGQSSATRWLSGGGFPIELTTEVRPDPIIEAARAFETTHDVIIADGPASLAESTRALLLVADFALVPCGVTVPELESTVETIRMIQTARMVRKAQEPRAALVLTRVRSDRFVLSREAREASQSLGLPACTKVMRLREAIADAAGQRTVVWKIGIRGKTAAHEMQQLMEEIDEHAGPEETNRKRDPDRRTTSVSQSRFTHRVAVGS